ncbi:MAG: ImuA family protein [Pirellulaceae bacterium]
MSEPIPVVDPSGHSRVDFLREQLGKWEARRPVRDTSSISSGCAALDALLPWGGLPRGALIECLERDEGVGGAGTLALLLARQAALEGGAIVILDPRHWFYPPAAVLLGMDLAAMLVIRAAQAGDQLWALDQCLRCPAVAAVWAPLEHLGPRDFRRLQLAAESGGGLGLLVRCSAARNQPSWSDLQLLIQPQACGAADVRSGRRLHVELTRCRQARSGGTIALEIDEVTGVLRTVSCSHEAYRLHPTAQLAYPTPDRRSARA